MRHLWFTEWITIIWIIAIIVLSGYSSNGQQYSDYLSSQVPLINQKEDANLFLREYDREASEMCNRVANAEWKYTTNVTEYNKRRMREQQTLSSKFECISWKRANAIQSLGYSDYNLRHQFEKILRIGHCGLEEAKLQELQLILTQMKDNYNNAKICPFTRDRIVSYAETYPEPLSYVRSAAAYCNLKLEPDLSRVMQRSRSESELRYAYTAWRDATGPPVRNNFMRYIDLANQAARIHGFRDAGEQMRAVYDDPNFFFTVQDLWIQIQPLYRQLFTFVRKGLYEFYGENIVRRDGPIPAHLLGNIWSQDWSNLLDLLKPGLRETPDITGEMIRQGYTPLRIFQIAEEFFTSMGLPPMFPEFWRNSILQRPSEEFSRCTASVWDFCNNVDFRINQCTQVTFEDLVNAHKEMAHIQYFMQYSSQSYVLRDGPNPAFHKAISNAIGLSAIGLTHLKQLGLLSKTIEVSSGNSLVNIEFLLSLALDKLPLMAFSLALEKWRWNVFEKGPIGMNGRWWELHLRYMGIIPPNHRTHENFDAGAKYHVIADQDYIKYFVGTILQFQIFHELCGAANHIGPLHTCDFYRSREAGKLLAEIMQKGATLSSEQIIKILTRGRTSKLSAQPLLEFFRPLEAWLEIQNRNEIIIGWNSNMDDVALYQELKNSASSLEIISTHLTICVLIFGLFKIFS